MCRLCRLLHIGRSPHKNFCRDAEGEPLIQYREGGYHPVHLHDKLGDGRYDIFDKLGEGRDGTVWLARDDMLSRNVAIKIFRSAFESKRDVLTSLQRLASGPETHPGKKHIAQLLDQFEVSGPNGRHLCLVFSALGPCIVAGELYRHPGVTWQYAKQVVEAVAYAHEVGVVHGDLRPKGFLFPTIYDPMEPVDEDFIGDIQPIDCLGNVSPVLASSFTPSVPRYLVTAPCRDFQPKDDEVKMIGISCLGSNVELQGLPNDPGNQAPELVLEGERSPKADIWSLGCLLFRFLDRRPLFDTESFSKEELIDAWVTVLGPLPTDWPYHPRSPGSYNPVELPGERDIRSRLLSDRSIRSTERRWRSSLAHLLESMVQYRPSNRPSAAEVLEHPWFKGPPKPPSFFVTYNGQKYLSHGTWPPT